MLHALTLSPDQVQETSRHPLLIITEGVLDISCLTRLSDIVRTIDPELPDLEELEIRGDTIFLPAGGGDLTAWTTRLAPLSCSEFFLFDREQQPETDLRQTVVDRINQRPGCRAVLTRKRSLENYLHPLAIAATFGISIDVTDDSPVAELIAQALISENIPWQALSRRSRNRLIYRVKRRLNTHAVQHMTLDLLAERDPSGEVVGWFQAIARLLS